MLKAFGLWKHQTNGPFGPLDPAGPGVGHGSLQQEDTSRDRQVQASAQCRLLSKLEQISLGFFM